MLWDKTITLYNKSEDAETGLIKWHKHRLENCFYKTTNNKINIGNVQMATGDNIIRIPEQVNYIPPHKWSELSDSEKSNKITLQSGDLIVLDDVTEEIDEYTQGKRSSDLIAKYSVLGCVSVKSVNINNFMLGAHYLVRGE